MADADTPYLIRGLQSVDTLSSVLISSSRYLNHPRLREWVATHFLRDSGRDRPTSADTYELYGFLPEVLDIERIETLFTRERRRWPELDQWFGAGFSSQFSVDDLLAYPEGSLGRIFGRYIADNNFQIDIVPRFEPQNQFQYFSLRSGQTHDLEHLMTGGDFDIIGELVPYYARLASLPRWLDPELAGLLNVGQLLGANRLVMRCGLHYPQSLPTALRAVSNGIAVGEQSGPYFMARYEDVFHLPLAEARAALGFAGVTTLSSAAASGEWTEYRPG